MSNWPALMSVDTAVSYLDGKRSVLVALIEAGLLQPVTRGHRCTTFRQYDIDVALAAAAEAAKSGSPLQPSSETIGRVLGAITPGHRSDSGLPTNERSAF